MAKLRALSLILSLAAAAAGISGCSQAAQDKSARLSVVCTTFPGYDWVKQIMGDKAADADITYLLENGTDMHNYNPTADDIIKISECDLFIYTGGESDEWVEKALESAVNKDMLTVNLLEAVGSAAKTEELKEGMQEEDEEEAGEEEEEEEYDEHIWLSVKNAKVICAEIADKLCELDADNSDTYRSDLAAYTAELDALDRDFGALAGQATEKTLVFGDRFPFRYFVDDYGLDYYAAFVGCSAETEASFETIVFLAGKVDELGCGTVYTIENSDGSIARTIINNTASKDQRTAVLNSLQSVTRAQIGEGASYISIMRENYDVLKETLK